MKRGVLMRWSVTRRRGTGRLKLLFTLYSIYRSDICVHATSRYTNYDIASLRERDRTRHTRHTSRPCEVRQADNRSNAARRATPHTFGYCAVPCAVPVLLPSCCAAVLVIVTRERDIGPLRQPEQTASENADTVTQSHRDPIRITRREHPDECRGVPGRGRGGRARGAAAAARGGDRAGWGA